MAPLWTSADAARATGGAVTTDWQATGVSIDTRTLKLRQVQLIPIHNTGRDVRFSQADGATVTANLRWSPAPSSRGVYANVKP